MEDAAQSAFIRDDRSTLRDYLAAARRRKWIILSFLVAVPLAAGVLSSQQERRYQASAEVLLDRGTLAATLSGVTNPDTTLQPERLAQTQARLARVPAVARRVLTALRVTDMSVDDFLEASDVAVTPNADLLVFSFTDENPAVAQRFATAYARQFTVYRRRLDTAGIARSLRDVGRRLRQLAEAEQADSALYANLIAKRRQLRTLEVLATSNALVVQAAEEAEQVQPRVLRMVALGAVLGLLLGIGLAFLREALDTRVRSAEEIGERLGLPLIGRLPEPPRRLRRADALVMLAEPNSAPAEAFRVLRTNLEIVNRAQEAKSIMLTSAVDSEGKSTTAANLALALARAGRGVVLVDCDLRRPTLARIFKLDDDHPGLTDVVAGYASLDDAIARVAITDMPAGTQAAATNGRGSVDLAVEVLAAGSVLSNAGEFVGTRAVAEILNELESRADLVLVDAPPLLNVGDALALSTEVDALLVVTHLSIVRRPLLRELRRVLDASPAAKLGFVLTGADREEGYAGRYYERVGTRAAAGEEQLTR